MNHADVFGWLRCLVLWIVDVFSLCFWWTLMCFGNKKKGIDFAWISWKCGPTLLGTHWLVWWCLVHVHVIDVVVLLTIHFHQFSPSALPFNTLSTPLRFVLRKPSNWSWNVPSYMELTRRYLTHTKRGKTPEMVLRHLQEGWKRKGPLLEIYKQSKVHQNPWNWLI